MSAHLSQRCGNRVTCRDWFQLTLKEGLTVYRDQLFSADLGSAAVKRIEDVRALRAAQFPEDAGPTAHPIRPESYIAMVSGIAMPTNYILEFCTSQTAGSSHVAWLCLSIAIQDNFYTAVRQS